MGVPVSVYKHQRTLRQGAGDREKHDIGQGHERASAYGAHVALYVADPMFAYVADS